ncbi:hypothetical protein P3T37_006409 [Kitasatospora sp. MAA4]|nr:hypothetical protein [Kitasatospora sp. MAA4]
MCSLRRRARGQTPGQRRVRGARALPLCRAWGPGPGPRLRAGLRRSRRTTTSARQQRPRSAIPARLLPARSDPTRRHAAHAARSPPGGCHCFGRPRRAQAAGWVTHPQRVPRLALARPLPRGAPDRSRFPSQHRSPDPPPRPQPYRSPRRPPRHSTNHRSTNHRAPRSAGRPTAQPTDRLRPPLRPRLRPWRSPGRDAGAVRTARPRQQVSPPGRCGGFHRPPPAPWATAMPGSSAPSAGHRCRNGAPCQSPPRAGRRRSPCVRECVWAYVGLRRSAESCADKEAIASVA